MGEARPRVSIGFPVYNGEKYMDEALDSVLAQTFEDFELIIVDNASTDRTPEISRVYAARDDRVRYHRNDRNLGQSANINRTIRLSTGSYYRQMHDDDRLHPGCLAACVDVLDRDPSVVVCHTETTVIDEYGQPTDGGKPMDFHLRAPRPSDRFEKFLKQCYPYSGLMNVVFGLIRRDVLLRTPLERSYPHSDIVLFSELALYGAFHVVPESLFVRRDHPGRSMRSFKDEAELAIWQDPKNAERAVLPRWQGLNDLVTAVQRAPVTRAEKLRCYRIIVQQYLRPFFTTIVREMKWKGRELLRTGASRMSHS